MGSKQWDEVRYKEELDGHCDQEGDAASLLTCLLNKHCGSKLRLRSRPDKERSKESQTRPKPDALYEDERNGLSLYIEVKRPWIEEDTRADRERRRFAAEIQKELHSPVACWIMVDQCWVPPSRPNERLRLRCELARAVDNEAQSKCQESDGEPGRREGPPLDLSGILPAEARPAEAFLMKWLTPSLAFWKLEDPGRYEHPEFRGDCRKAYANLLWEANRKFADRVRTESDAVFVLDARLGAALFPYGLDELRQWHRRAGDLAERTGEQTPFLRADFEYIDHVVTLEVGPSGVCLVPVWSRSGARFTMPPWDQYLPEGWEMLP